MSKTVGLILALVVAGVNFVPAAFGASTERVSISDMEAQGSGFGFAMTPDARFVVFESSAPNLIAGDTNSTSDIFVRDRLLGTTAIISVSSDGTQGDQQVGSHVAISPNGRFIVFTSNATNLVAGDTNGTQDVFIHDRNTGVTERVNVGPGGVEANGFSYEGSVSNNGRYVAFGSGASNLVVNDTNGQADIFVHDRTTDTTELISISSAQVQSDAFSSRIAISANGRFVVFASDATTLTVPNDLRSGCTDVFIHDRLSDTTEKVSVNQAGGEANSCSSRPAITPDSLLVAFESSASDLVADDTNGQTEIFVRNLQTATTARLLASSDTVLPDGLFSPVMSSNGRFIAFQSEAANLVPGDRNDAADIFVVDRQTQSIQRVNVDSAGRESKGRDLQPFRQIGSDGRFVAFTERVSDLVPDDTNNNYDVFIRDRSDLSASRNELLADLGNKGLWQRFPTGRWEEIDPDSPIAIATGDLDRNFHEDVIASFSGRGLEARFAGSTTWQNLHATAPDRVVSGDFDGNGVADIAGDFGAAGLLVSNNNGAWVRRAAASEGLAVADMDGNGKDELIADRGATGLWARYNGGNAWVRLHPDSPVHFAAGDLDGDGLDDVIADLGPGKGLFVRWNDSDPWLNVLIASSERLAIGDLDDNGRDEIIGDFPNGLRARFNNSSPWITLDTRSPRRMISLDLDRNGEDDIVADFDDAGISVRLNNNSSWVLLRPARARDFAKGSFN